MHDLSPFVDRELDGDRHCADRVLAALGLGEVADAHAGSFYAVGQMTTTI